MLHSIRDADLTQRLECGSFFSQYVLVPERKIGENPKGTTLEPLVMHRCFAIFLGKFHVRTGSKTESLGSWVGLVAHVYPAASLKGVKLWFFQSHCALYRVLYEDTAILE